MSKSNNDVDKNIIYNKIASAKFLIYVYQKTLKNGEYFGE